MIHFFSSRKLNGFSLLEMMLVLAIMASFILFGINQYQNFLLQASFIDIKKNVNVLFQAMGRYYQANCRTLSNNSVAWVNGTVPQTLTPGSLAPGGTLEVNYSNTTPTTYTLNISTELPSYLPNNWPTFVPEVSTTTGYTASFIFLKDTKSAYQCWWDDSTGSISIICGTPTTIQPNQVAFWLAQVSVKINNDPTGDKTKAFLGATGASCASSVPDSCNSGGTLNYLIWQQLPTKSGNAINSDLWVSQQQEAMFNQQYTHDVMYEMANPSYTNSMTDRGNYYYLCGN